MFAPIVSLECMFSWPTHKKCNQLSVRAQNSPFLITITVNQAIERRKVMLN